MKKGDWLFTCSMQPKQFGKWQNEDMDDFETIEGSSHNKNNCGLKPISENYAQWFLKNEFWNFYHYLNNGMFKYRWQCKGFVLKNEIVKKGHRRYFVYKDFECLLPYKDKHITIWYIYESYVKFMAEKENILFEGV